MQARARSAIFLIALVLALGAIVYFRARSAPLPPVFAERLSLAEGRARAAASGKPLLVFASADWCVPCQSFKRTTLIDPAVEALVRDEFVPVYLNVDQDPEGAASLGIVSIPASVLEREGHTVAKLQGACVTEEYLAFLRSAVEAPAPPG